MNGFDSGIGSVEAGVEPVVGKGFGLLWRSENIEQYFTK